jgi:F-type H+-transporting ATPase subunit epsilon
MPADQSDNEKLLYLELITPDKKLYSGKVKLIQVPGTKGSFEILKNHAPIISTLEQGTIKIIDQQDQEDFFDIQGGVIEVNKNKVIILSESEQE